MLFKDTGNIGDVLGRVPGLVQEEGRVPVLGVEVLGGLRIRRLSRRGCRGGMTVAPLPQVPTITSAWLCQGLGDGHGAIRLGTTFFIPLLTHQVGLTEEAVKLRGVLGPEGQHVTQGQVGSGGGAYPVLAPAKGRADLPPLPAS